MYESTANNQKWSVFHLKTAPTADWVAFLIRYFPWWWKRTFTRIVQRIFFQNFIFLEKKWLPTPKMSIFCNFFSLHFLKSKNTRYYMCGRNSENQINRSWKNQKKDSTPLKIFFSKIFSLVFFCIKNCIFWHRRQSLRWKKLPTSPTLSEYLFEDKWPYEDF